MQRSSHFEGMSLDDIARHIQRNPLSQEEVSDVLLALLAKCVFLQEDLERTQAILDRHTDRIDAHRRS